MSEKVVALLDDLKSAFGRDFGESQPIVENVGEAVALELTERNRPLPSRGGFAPPGAMAGRHVPPERRPGKHAKGVNKEKRSAEKRGAAAMADFYKDVDKAAWDAEVRRRERAKQDAERDIEREVEKYDRPAPKPGGMMKLRPKRAAGGGGGASSFVPPARRGGGGSGGHPGHTDHNPFKHNANLGLGPGDPPVADDGGERHHDEQKCWHCKCGNIYSAGCICIGTGAKPDCPRGKRKHVVIDKGYRTAYNRMYHAWRDEKRGGPETVTGRAGTRTRTGY